MGSGTRSAGRRALWACAVPVALVVALAGGPAWADDSSATGEVDGVPVGVGEALVPPPEPVATTVLDGVDVGVGEALVPPAPPVVTVAPAPAPRPTTTVTTTLAPAAPTQAVSQNATISLVLSAWS